MMSLYPSNLVGCSWCGFLHEASMRVWISTPSTKKSRTHLANLWVLHHLRTIDSMHFLVMVQRFVSFYGNFSMNSPFFPVKHRLYICSGHFILQSATLPNNLHVQLLVGAKEQSTPRLFVNISGSLLKQLPKLSQYWYLNVLCLFILQI